MKFLIAFIALAVVAVSAKPGFFTDEPSTAAIASDVQPAIVNIGYAADDLNTMEGQLTPLTADTSVSTAATAITTAMDVADLENSFNTA